MVGLDKIHCFVDWHGNPTTMDLYMTLNVAHLWPLLIVPCKVEIANFKFQKERKVKNEIKEYLKELSFDVKLDEDGFS